MYSRKARTEQSKARAGSASSRGSACRLTTWSLKGVVGTLGTLPGQGLSTTWPSPGPNSRHDSSTENASRSPTLLMEANSTSNKVFIDRILKSADCKGSKGAIWSARSTRARSQEGMEGGRGGFNRLAPLRNLTTRSCLPIDLPSMWSWYADIAAA